MGEPAIHSVGRALPKHRADQQTLLAALRKLWGKSRQNPARVDSLFESVRVSQRFLAMPVEDYERHDTFRKCNDAWIRSAVELGEAATREALDRAGLTPTDVDHVFFVTVTGIAVPSVDARLVNRLGLRRDVKRTPIFGLGCVAGASGIARASDYLRAFPGEVALLLSTELCSLTLQRDDLSVANLIAAALFGDGAAAVVLGGGARPSSGPRVIATRSIFYPDTERLMGWEVGDAGFKIVLGAGVPEIVYRHLRGDVDEFLTAHQLTRADLRHFIVHTGGPKVLDAVAEALSLPSGALRRSWEALENTGNLSSASVLLVLRELLASGEAKPGDLGLLAAMGPGFCSELVLLRW
jgi:alkylresorcinol/alkylpyrone synthase